MDDFSLKNQLNVMSVPQEEEEEGNVSESTIFTSKQPSAPAVKERVPGQKRVYIYDTHQSEEYLGGKTVLDGRQAAWRAAAGGRGGSICGDQFLF